jgi:ParB-like chromosome segregation protein Spo0J
VRPTHAHDISQNVAGIVPVSSLLPADSPRLNGIDDEYAHTLAETEDALPPIIVHHPTMRVVDGMHRLRAAVLRGQEQIAVQFVHDEVDVFALAVETNIRHGLPLSRADRKAAAIRLIRSHPEWSDRRITAITTVSARTVATLRTQVLDSAQRTTARIGKDGRVRPLDRNIGQQRAIDFMKSNPDASVRSVARAAGVSPATVVNIRKRSNSEPGPAPSGGRPAKLPVQRADWNEILSILTKDPSLSLSGDGRLLLRSLHMCTIDLEARKGLAEAVPTHCADRVAALARAAGAVWFELADKLESHEDEQPPEPS